METRRELASDRTAAEGQARGDHGRKPRWLRTARGQAHLRLVLTPLDARVLSVPEVLVNYAGDKFSDGRLTDDNTRTFLRDTFLPALASWIRRLHG